MDCVAYGCNSHVQRKVKKTFHSYPSVSCSNPTTGVAPQLFSSALQFFATAQCLINPEPLRETKLTNCEKFDFIIVGAGTAGCVVANRLSENENISVLLIEAGADAPEESRIPGLDNAVRDTKYDWQYLTTNDGRTNKANKNGSVSWPRGKMFGGSSNINGMIYIKGRRYEYEEWYKAGNADWHPDIVEKYFKKAESYQYQDLLRDEAVNKEYGHKGPLVINRFNSTFRDLTENILKSWKELGITTVKDLNIPEEFSNNIAGITSCTAANGTRQSSEIAYIYPIQNRPNLKILKNTLARKVLIDNSNKAYGVEIERKGKILRVYAGLEVILSAGAINSPQLIMLSGVGPKAHLESKNIVCKVDSPLVGQNLQDHLRIPVTIYGSGPEGPDMANQYFGDIQYLYNRTGYLAQGRFSDVIAFYSSSKKITYPEYQNHVILIWKNSSSTVYSTFSDGYRYNEPIPSSIVELNKNNTLYNFAFHVLHPESRGNISLKTNDPNDYPLIYPNYFLNQRDLDSAVVGIKMLTKIVDTTFFKSINGFLGRMNWPECNDLELDSVAYWKCICINMVLTVFHPVGTCQMGPKLSTSVVDSRLRVHGVTSLRVIDASVMPIITSGNTNGPTFMIGERGADLVKQDHNL